MQLARSDILPALGWTTFTALCARAVTWQLPLGRSIITDSTNPSKPVAFCQNCLRQDLSLAASLMDNEKKKKKEGHLFLLNCNRGAVCM